MSEEQEKRARRLRTMMEIRRVAREHVARLQVLSADLEYALGLDPAASEKGPVKSAPDWSATTSVEWSRSQKTWIITDVQRWRDNPAEIDAAYLDAMTIVTSVTSAAPGAQASRTFACQGCGKVIEILHGSEVSCRCGTTSSAEILPPSTSSPAPRSGAQVAPRGWGS